MESRAESDVNWFYVQLNKHPVYQRWGKDDTTAPLPTLKDAFVFAACVGWANEVKTRSSSAGTLASGGHSTVRPSIVSGNRYRRLG